MTSTRTIVQTAVEQTAAERTAASEATRTRAEILAPYAQRLGIGESVEGATPELPPIVDLGDYILELEDWERMVLRAYAGGTDAKGRPWPGLIAEGLAYQVRCIDRAAALDGKFIPPPDQRAELIDQLIIDGSIGITLLDDLQWAIDRLIREGQVRVAGRLADFRNAVNHNVSRVRSFVGSATFASSESAARESSEGRIRTCWPDLPAEAEGDARPRPPVPVRPRPPRSGARPHATARARTAHEIAEPSPSRVLPLSIVLVVSFLLWFFVAPHRAESDLPRELTGQDFAHVPSVAQVEARPPSLYLTVNARRWRKMSDLERWQALDQIGTIADRAGYVGAHVRTSDGETVGRWSRRGGAKVVERPRGAS